MEEKFNQLEITVQQLTEEGVNTTLEDDFFRRTLNGDKKSDIINNCPCVKAISETTRSVDYLIHSLLQDITDVSPNDH
ncbi:hypothetical protein BB560_000801 [Smittium megazygosporum]|uniref:Uncharacterized protein n=1 Tax=Smittium megazygosporum TaxID=133381 RepID=A0A2T9ZJG1_9FUNG|nr:hypothetical protein BB560_000801 [Smittium megazygosporum]